MNAWAIGLSALLILASIWAAVRFIQVPGYGSWRSDHEGNLGAAFDRTVFGNSHLSDWGGPKRMWIQMGCFPVSPQSPTSYLES